MNLLKSSLRLTLSSGITSIISFVTLAYYANRLNVSIMGQYFLFITFVGIFVLVFDFGVSGAVEKRMSEGESNNAVFSAGLMTKITSLMVISIVIILFEKPINTYFGFNAAMISIIAIALKTLYRLLIFSLRGEMKISKTADIKVVNRLSTSLFGVVLVSYNFGLDGLLMAWFAGHLISFGYCTIEIESSITRFNREDVLSMYNYAKYNYISGAGGYLYSWLDLAIIGLFLTSADVGAYEYAWKVSGLILVFSKSLSTTIFPMVSNTYGSGDGEIDKILSYSIVGTLYISLPGFFATMLLSDNVLVVLFGEEFLIAAVAMEILMFEKMIQSVTSILGRTLDGMDYVNLSARATLGAIITNIVLNTILIPIYGISGAAVGTTLSVIVGSILYYKYLSQHVSIDLKLELIKSALLSSILMATYLKMVTSIVTVDTKLSLLTVVITGAAVYFGATFLSKNAREDIYKPIVENI